MLSQEVDVSFIDVNIGCPIDFVFKKVGRLLVSGFFKIFSNLDIFGVSRLRNYSKSVSVTSMPTISYKIVEPPPGFQFICPCFPPSPLVNVAVPQKVAESRVSSRSGTFFKTTLTWGKGGRKFHFFLGWLNNFVTDCLKM